MKMQDLRLVEIQQREGMAFGLKEIISTLVGGSILLMLGLFAYSKVSGKINLLDGGTYINTTSYCPATGTWNGTDCLGATVTNLPANYAQDQAALTSVRTNVTSGFDLTSMIFYIAAIVGIIGVIWLAFR